VDVHWRILRALGKMRDRAVAHKLVVLLADERLGYSVRRRIAETLGLFGDSSAVGELLRLFIEEQANEGMRLSIVQVAGQLGGPSIAGELVLLLANPGTGPTLRNAIVAALVPLVNDAETVEAILPFLPYQDMLPEQMYGALWTISRRVGVRLTPIPASLAARARAFKLHWASPSSSRATIVPSRCVTSRPGGAWRTNAISWLLSSAVKRRGRPDLDRSPRPSMPSASKRCRRRRTVCALHPTCLAMASTRSPSQLRATMRACRIQSAGPCRLAASLRTQRSSYSSWGARTRRILGSCIRLLGLLRSASYSRRYFSASPSGSSPCNGEDRASIATNSSFKMCHEMLQ
jgi:hypothetical protein